MSDKKWLKYDHALTYDVYDGRKSQILSSIYYDINGNVLESEDNNESNSNYTRLVPGTIGMSAFDELNKQHVFEINGEEFKVYMEDVINFIVKNPDAIYFGNTEWVQYVSDYIQGRINEM